MLCVVSTRYYEHAKNQLKLKIQHKGQVMAPFKKSQNLDFFLLLHIKVKLELVLVGRYVEVTHHFLSPKSLFNGLKERPR